MGAQAVGCGEVDGIISFADVKSATINLYALQGLGDKYVGIRITVAMGIRR